MGCFGLLLDCFGCASRLFGLLLDCFGCVSRLLGLLPECFACMSRLFGLLLDCFARVSRLLGLLLELRLHKQYKQYNKQYKPYKQYKQFKNQSNNYYTRSIPTRGKGGSLGPPDAQILMPICMVFGGTELPGIGGIDSSHQNLPFPPWRPLYDPI